MLLIVVIQQKGLLSVEPLGLAPRSFGPEEVCPPLHARAASGCGSAWLGFFEAMEVLEKMNS